MCRCCMCLPPTRSAIPYAGYRICFGRSHPIDAKFFAYDDKADFNLPAGSEFSTIDIPFTNFSDLWDDATGDAIRTCQEDKRHCPDRDNLANIAPISIWAEGVSGKVRLEIKQLAATGCAGAPTADEISAAYEVNTRAGIARMLWDNFS